MIIIYYFRQDEKRKQDKNYQVLKKILFTGNIPRGVFCERRSQKTRDIPREFMRLA